MGALSFAGRKFAGIACGVAGFIFGMTFFFMGALNAEFQWSFIVGIIILLAGIIFGIYFWRSADHHV